MTPVRNAKAARLAPAASVIPCNWPANPTAANEPAQRLPAYGRRLRDAIEAGYLPETGGGAVIVVTDWDCASAFHPGRLVCPPDVAASAYRFDFLRGIEVAIVVAPCHRDYGEALRVEIEAAGAALVVLAINPEGEQ